MVGRDSFRFVDLEKAQRAFEMELCLRRRFAPLQFTQADPLVTVQGANENLVANERG